jgi:hypothetical protein
MRQFFATSAAAAAILASGVLFPSGAQAMPLGAPAPDGLTPIEKVAVCFYLDGWNGPGLYQCGFRNRHGSGWVSRREERREFRGERREDRGERREEHRGDHGDGRGEYRR